MHYQVLGGLGLGLAMIGNGAIVYTRTHKNRRLEEERVTPIEACSPGKIIEPY